MTGKIRTLLGSEYVALLGIVLLFLVLGIASLTSLLPPDGDDASYVVLAESLAHGGGYVNTMYPGNPAEAQYPPLLPLLLSPIVRLLGRNYLALKLVPLAFGAGALALIHRLFRRRVSPGRALAVTLLTALNATYLNLSTSILTETVYLFFSAVALLAIDHIAGLSEGEDRVKGPLTAALWIAAAFYTRTVGVTLAAAALLFLLLRRRPRAAFALAGVLLALLGWWGWRSIALNNSYVYQLLEKGAEGPRTEGILWVGRLSQNLPRYAGKVMADLIGGPAVARMDPYQPVKIAGSLMVALLFAAGYAADLRRGITAERLYLLIYLGLYAVWPYHDARFLVPALPFILLHLFSGIEALASPWPAVYPRVRNFLTAVLLCVGMSGCLSLVYHNRTGYYYPETAHYRDACLWIKTHAPSDALLLCRRPREAALWSERKAWRYPDTLGTEAFVGAVGNLHASHLVVNDYPIVGINLAEQFAGILRLHPQKFHLIYETAPPRVLVYEVRSDREGAE